jgi:glycosyltransferase involved in cell wall biosynthesis
LSKRFPQVEMVLSKSWWAGVIPNYRFLVGACRRRLWKSASGPVLTAGVKPLPLWLPEVRRVAPDVILAGGEYPSNAGCIPILFETFYLDPSSWLFDGNAEDEDAWALRKGIFRRFAARARVIGLRGSTSIRMAREDFPDLAERIHDLPYYLPDLEPVADTAITEKQTHPSPLKVLFAGRMANLKGLPQVVDAVQRARGALSGHVNLTIISRFDDGPVSLPGGDWIRVLDDMSWNETQAIMRESHVFLMPSWRESYGLVYLEAMAAGCVVVARDREPQREIIDYGEAGVLADPRDINGMAEQLVRLTRDQEWRIKLALAGYRRFRDRYHWSVVGPRWVNAISACVSGRQAMEVC